MFSEVVNGSLDFYRKRKPLPTLHCIFDGQSCSQRFESAFNSAIRDGVSGLSAFSQAIKLVLEVCQNSHGEVTVRSSVVRFIKGTSLSIIVGPSFASDEGECCFRESGIGYIGKDKYERAAYMSQLGAQFRAGLEQKLRENPEKSLRQVYEEARQDLIDTQSD